MSSGKWFFMGIIIIALSALRRFDCTMLVWESGVTVNASASNLPAVLFDATMNIAVIVFMLICRFVHDILLMVNVFIFPVAVVLCFIISFLSRSK